ncbi:hypothetical protein NX784_13110 [Massilia pinisoli]|uniref:DUF2092 domain-containing protein n=1 Tax=Massilia pinisoli TaxID=1772194 RepID=A0ABT1ZRH0_9BURK|nr:hypothetical protein [Massilia pinisoli]MCS0582533.1 hypothetical protein [Massilia pinisoli]
MKVFSTLFSLLIACQALPVTMHTAAAQADDEAKTVGAEMTRAAMEQFGPVRLRNEYNFAVARLKSHDGKPRAYTYDVVTDTATALAGGNAIKSQSKESHAFDKTGRSRTAWTQAGVERIAIADPATQTAYLICPERKEILRMKSPATTVAPAMPTPEPASSVTSTNLGEKEIAGVKAFGSKSEITIPAGAQGNDKPLVHTTETWFSTELGLLMYMNMSMPEFGDMITRVENLKFGDVPASTFALPEGYAIRDIAPDSK